MVCSCLRELGGGMSSSSFTVFFIVEDNDVHGILIVLRLIGCFFEDCSLTVITTFWFPLLRRAKNLSII